MHKPEVENVPAIYKTGDRGRTHCWGRHHLWVGAFWSPPLFFILFYFLEVDFFYLIYLVQLTLFFWLAFFKATIYFYSGFFQSQAFLLIHLRWPKRGYQTISKRIKTMHTMQSKTLHHWGTMFDSQGKFHLHTSHKISSCFSILHVHTGTANSRKAWKYKNISRNNWNFIRKHFFQLFHSKIQTLNLFPGILKIDCYDFKVYLTLPHLTQF